MGCRYDSGAAPSTLQAALLDFFPDDLAQWLLKEMQQNRNRALESQKVWATACLCMYLNYPCLQETFELEASVFRVLPACIPSDVTRMHNALPDWSAPMKEIPA